jgi:ElaB/YqjD/DUF883 family membrane-anchored ribosome-binding protein
MTTRRNHRAKHSENMTETVERKLRDLGEEAQDRMSEMGEVAREQAREWEDGLAEMIREKPLRSVLIAAGVGLLVGAIWRR